MAKDDCYEDRRQYIRSCLQRRGMTQKTLHKRMMTQTNYECRYDYVRKVLSGAPGCTSMPLLRAAMQVLDAEV